MGLFRGMFYNNDPQNHVFVTNHPAMAYAGLRSFNLNLIRQFSQETRLQNVVANAFGRLGIRIDRGLDLVGLDEESVFLERVMELLGMRVDVLGGAFMCTAYDIEARSYNPGTIFDVNEIVEMLKWYEETWLPSSQDKDDTQLFNASAKEYYRKINSIKNSIEKYAVAERYVTSDDHITEQGFENIYLRLYFADKAVLSSSRVVVPKGPPRFTDVPRRPTGKKYSHGKSAKQPIGVSIDQEDSDLNDPEDAVVADMRMSYNSAIKKWEVQNQILARLLTDVDPAPIRSIPLDAEDVDAIPAEDFSQVGGERYLGQFSTGLAMPLSSENGNPHTFGPNLIKCNDGTECEKIRVFNRANKTYTKGQLVICHFIGNEWIIQDFGADLESIPRAVGVGTWQFGKYITSTNTHFREADPPKQDNGDFAKLQIRPDEWTTILRKRFYDKKKTDSANKAATAVGTNSNTNFDAKLNTCIMQSTIWDQYNNGQQFKIINPTGKGTDPMWNEVAPMYWGPVFDGGFAKNVTAMGKEGIAYLPERNGAVDEVDDLIHFEGYGRTLGSDRESIRSAHLPPEVAVNGPWGEDSSPVESYHNMAQDINNNNYDFMFSHTHQYYSYYSKEDDSKGTFALKPNDPNVVTFIALAGEFAAADDLLAQDIIIRTGYTNDRSFYTKARLFGVGDVGMGAALTRGDPEVGIYNAEGCSDGLQPTSILDEAKLNSVNGGDEGGEDGEIDIESVKTVPYDHYVESKFDNSIIGPCDPYQIPADGDNQGAECLGIITARTKILRSGGGAVTFETINNFGMVGTVTAFRQDSTLSILPIGGVGVALGSAGSFSVNPRSKVWGNREQGPENFGITALHVQIFDYWPPDQTLYIAPYFTILHFNGGVFGSSPLTYVKYFRPKPSQVNVPNFKDPVAGTPTDQMIADEQLVPARIQALGSETSTPFPSEGVDFRVPTYGGFSRDGESVKVGTLITPDEELRPREYWNVETNARGLLLSDGGAVSVRIALGVAHKEDGSTLLPDRYNIIEGGEGFDVGQKVTSITGGVRIEVTSTSENGVITGFKFVSQNAEEFSQGNLGPGGYELGDFDDPSDFPKTFSFLSGATGGVTSRIKFTRCMTYRKKEYHRAPERYTPAFKGTRISESCGDGSQYVRGKIKTTSITLEDNSSYHPYPGEYEAFFYFHNDITHTFMGGTTLNSNPYLQYIKLTIS